MSFKWRIVRPPYQGVVDHVQVTQAGIEVDFETGSIEEALGIFEDGGTALAEMFGGAILKRAIGLANEAIGGEAPGTAAAPVETDKERKARERKEKKNAADPSTAVAPAPLAIPGVEAPPTAPVTEDDGIPAALRRTAELPPVPPAAPAAPPAPPAAPPTGVLAGKIAAELDKRATGAADGGQALADWLATSGITVKGATYPEAVAVLRLQADEKLGPIATALGVS